MYEYFNSEQGSKLFHFPHWLAIQPLCNLAGDINIIHNVYGWRPPLDDRSDALGSSLLGRPT